MSGWVRVSRAEPCVVCKKPDYCTRSADGNVAKCMRVSSEKESEQGGWIHRLTEPLPPVKEEPKQEKRADWTEEAKAMFVHERACEKRHEVAQQLGVSVQSLEDLRVGIGWDDWNGKEFSSWPSRNDQGKVIGYVRRYVDGVKRTNKGGSTGVFYVPYWWKKPGPVFVVEGGSDVAACETAGLCSIGRASNVHGGSWIKRMIGRKCPEKQVIVVGERDDAPDRRGAVASCPDNCRGCAFCWPGKYGMDRVASQLGGVGVLVPDGFKDMREFLASGEVWLDLVQSVC